MTSSSLVAKAEEKLSRKARVALGLALGERALAGWQWTPEARAPMDAALQKCWSRLETGAPAALEVYEPVERIIELNVKMANAGAQRKATTTVANAVYYLLWVAFSEEVDSNRLELRQVPGEMFDGGDHMFGDVLDAFGKCGRPDADGEARALLERLIDSPHAQQPARGVRELLLA